MTMQCNALFNPYGVVGTVLLRSRLQPGQCEVLGPGGVWVGAECPQQSAAATVQFTLATSRHCTPCTTQYFPSSPPHLLGERKLYELFW